MNVMNVGDRECEMFGMSDVRVVECWVWKMLKIWVFMGYGMLELWDNGDVGYSGCAVFWVWNVWAVGCLECGMLEMLMFGMWGFGDVGCWYTKFTDTDSFLCEIKTKNVYEDFKKDKETFDFSNYSNILWRVKQINCWEDERWNRRCSYWLTCWSKSKDIFVLSRW